MNGPTPKSPHWQSPEWLLIEKEIGTAEKMIAHEYGEKLPEVEDILAHFARMVFMTGAAYSLRMTQDTVLKPFGELMQQVQERVKNL